MISESLQKIVRGQVRIDTTVGICRNVTINSHIDNSEEPITVYELVNVERILKTFFRNYFKGFDICQDYPVESFYAQVHNLEVNFADLHDTTKNKFAGDIGRIRWNLMIEAVRIFKDRVDSKMIFH